MPPGNEGQLSDVDLDQKIAERSRAIALNQNDAKAYRDRGLLLARKREYDCAMSDLNKALLLNSNDAHAFGLRGLVWEKKNDSTRALADLEKAIQLDPTNAAVYRSHRENTSVGDRQLSRFMQMPLRITIRLNPVRLLVVTGLPNPGNAIPQFESFRPGKLPHERS